MQGTGRFSRSGTNFRIMRWDVDDDGGEAAQRGPGSGLGGDWRVIVRNDNHNTFEHVAETLARVLPGVSLDRVTVRRKHPQQRPGDRLVRAARAGRALLAAARGRGPDDGAARAGVSGSRDVRRRRRCSPSIALLAGGPGQARGEPELPERLSGQRRDRRPRANRRRSASPPTAASSSPRRRGRSSSTTTSRTRVADPLRRSAHQGLRRLRSWSARHGPRPRVPDAALRIRPLHLRPRARRRRAARRAGASPDHAGDECPEPKGADDCLVSGRLVRLTASGDTTDDDGRRPC